jgi:hypothetical protein
VLFCRMGRAADQTGVSHRVGLAVRSQQQRAPRTFSRPVAPHRAGGRHRATLMDGVTLCDGKDPRRTLAEPPGAVTESRAESSAARRIMCSELLVADVHDGCNAPSACEPARFAAG